MSHSEVPVALVLARHAHDGPGAVGHQHVVGQVERDRAAREGIHDGRPAGDTPLVESPLGGQPLDLALRRHGTAEHLDGVTLRRRRQLVEARMLGRQDRVRDAEPGVGTGREHLDRGNVGAGPALAIRDRKTEFGALRAPDPVSLHVLDALGPVDAGGVVEEALSVGGDAEEPLGQLAVLNEIAGTLARAVGEHLLVGQHRLAPRAPVDRRGVPVRQARLVEPQEDPLRPMDVLGVVAADHPS